MVVFCNGANLHVGYKEFKNAAIYKTDFLTTRRNCIPSAQRSGMNSFHQVPHISLFLIRYSHGISKSIFPNKISQFQNEFQDQTTRKIILRCLSHWHREYILETFKIPILYVWFLLSMFKNLSIKFIN